MKSRRGFAIALWVTALVALAGLAAACGDGDNGGAPAGAGADNAATADIQVAIDEITAMVSAAEEDNLEGAQTAFDAAHDPLHEVIDVLEATDSDLATELDEAVDDAETDLEEGEEAEHIVEIGNEILVLLQDATAEIGP